MRTVRLKKSIILLLISAVVFTFAMVPNGTEAAYADEYDNKISAKEGELSDIKSQQEEVEGELAQVKRDIQAAQYKLDNINASITATVKEIEDTQAAIA